MKNILLLSLIVGAGAIGRTAPADVATAALADFFKPGVVWQDKNGDGAVDFVDAHIVLPERPTSAELAAAADVAARLGFETSAMNLPLTDVADGPSIFIGNKSLSRANVRLDAIGGSGLQAGDGVVTAFTLAGRPAVAVLGGDDAGLTAAAVMLAGHLPFLRDQKSQTTEVIAGDVREFLAGKGVNVASSHASSVAVRDKADGVERVGVELQMAGAGDLVKAQVALMQFKATGSRDPKRALSYADARSLRIRLRAAGSRAITVDLPSVPAAVAAAAQPPARRPGGGAKENFDLSTFYGNEGALADSDNNLIPDRVDVLLSADGDGTDGVVDLAARLGLESTGVSLPIAKPAKAISPPDSEPILVLIGPSHPVIDTLIKTHKWQPPTLEPGEGLIQVVKKAFGEKSAVIVTGGDAAGVDRAVHQLPEKFP